MEIKFRNRERDQYNRIIDVMAGKLSEVLGTNEMEQLIMELSTNEIALGEYDNNQPIHDAISIISDNLF